MAEFLNEQVQKQVQEVFTGLKHPVQVVLFTSEEHCDFCADTRQLLEEVTGLSDLLGLTVYDLEKDRGLAKQYQIDKAPAFTVTAKEDDALVDYRVRYSGIPSGHEFTTLINDLVMVSNRNSGLSQETVDFLKGIDQPVILEVLVTPT